MSQANFVYSHPANDAAGLPLALSIFADRSHLRAALHEDAEAAGFRVTQAAGVADLLEGAARPLGDVVLLDCPVVDSAWIAALARLDMRAAHCGAQLIVSTSVEALDDVFACMDQSKPHILVDPGRADRVIALGRVLAGFSKLRLRELSEEDRLMLLRLTEQVGQIAERLDKLAGGQGTLPDSSGASRLEAPRRGFSGEGDDDGKRQARLAQPVLPDPRLVRRLIRQRQLRARFFDGDLFADPAWDMRPKGLERPSYLKAAA